MLTKQKPIKVLIVRHFKSKSIAVPLAATMSPAKQLVPVVVYLQRRNPTGKSIPEPLHHGINGQTKENVISLQIFAEEWCRRLWMLVWLQSR